MRGSFLRVLTCGQTGDRALDQSRVVIRSKLARPISTSRHRLPPLNHRGDVPTIGRQTRALNTPLR